MSTSTTDPVAAPRAGESAAPTNPVIDAAVEIDGPGPSTPAQRTPGLKQRVYSAGAWVAFSFGSRQALGLASNLVMVRLLAPEDFGLLGLIMVVITGLNMFSDVGIGPSLIQNEREDSAFHNTAWTLQVIRGVVLWLVASALAYPLTWIGPDWQPVSVLLPVAAFSCVIRGFRSTAWYMNERKLDFKAKSVIELSSSIIRIAAMVSFAYFISPTAWALVIGVVVGDAVNTVLSHKLLHRVGNRFGFEREAFGALIQYGRWIFLSTAITFFAGQIDKLILVNVLTASVFGWYWLAVQISNLMPSLFQQLGSFVGFPALSDLYRRDVQRFHARLKHLRMVLSIPLSVMLVGLIASGPLLLRFFYGGRYSEVGWIVQVLAFGGLGSGVVMTYGNAYMARGSTFINMLTVLFQTIIVALSMIVGYVLGGETGCILGVAAAAWLKYPADMMLAKHCGIWQWRLDLPLLICSAAGAWGAVAFSNWLVGRIYL